MEAIIKQVCGIRCMSCLRKDGCNVLSCPEAIGRALKERMGEKRAVNKTGNLCPECGAPLEQSEGCVICHSCGYSKCG